jgi:hypothetical protein
VLGESFAQGCCQGALWRIDQETFIVVGLERQLDPELSTTLH